MRLYCSIFIAVLTFGLLVPAIAWADVFCAFCIVNGGGEQGEQGEQGPRGPRGATGAQGEQGDIGLTGEAGLDGKDYFHDDDAWSNDDLDQMFAASTAMAGIDFDSTTSKLQLGVALGGFNGETATAVGIAKVWDSKNTGDILFSLKTTVDEQGRGGDEARPWVAAATWRVKLQ